jgi:hypothetical protein
MSSSSPNSFNLILPSYTRKHDPPPNRNNKFKIRLPKTLVFDGTWLCGFATIHYPHNFPTIGTTETQAIYVLHHDPIWKRWPHSLIRIKFPSGTYKSPTDLGDALNQAVQAKIAELEAAGTRKKRLGVP